MVGAVIAQLFIEAKQNQPTVIYIPFLVGWHAAVTETSWSIVCVMLNTLPQPSAHSCQWTFSDLPHDIKVWFGPMKDNWVKLPIHSAKCSLRDWWRMSRGRLTKFWIVWSAGSGYLKSCWLCLHWNTISLLPLSWCCKRIGIWGPWHFWSTTLGWTWLS